MSIRTLVSMHLLSQTDLLIVRYYLLPFISCKCGLVATLWQSSVTKDAVMSHILLCCVVRPPMWQTMAWHTVNVAAQLHVWEVFVRLHSYLKHGESQNSSLWNSKSSKRRTADHDDSPCSVYSAINPMMFLRGKCAIYGLSLFLLNLSVSCVAIRATRQC